MHCSTAARHYRSRRFGKIIRPRKDRVLGGVCAGIAEHFDLSLFWTRFIFMIGVFTQPHLVFVFYIVALIVMPSEGRFNHKTKSRFNQPPTPPPTDAVPTVIDPSSFDGLEKQFFDIESRIQILEDHVTSKEYTLLRKFNELQS